jgi:hypothetical protein
MDLPLPTRPDPSGPVRAQGCADKRRAPANEGMIPEAGTSSLNVPIPFKARRIS